MNLTYKKLFETYGDSILRDIDAYCCSDEINDRLDALSLDERTKITLNDLFFEYYYRWSTNAFTLGLHLGLTLLHDNIRRTGPQQVQ